MVFREGDKVMQIKNNYNIHWERYEDGSLVEDGDGVFNGDVGYVDARRGRWGDEGDFRRRSPGHL